VPSDKEPERLKGKQEITGIVRAAQKLNFIGRAIVFDNQPKKQLWFWLDLPQMYESLNLPPKDFYLDMINTGKSTSYPIALPVDLKLYNEHLQYAITWYLLSIALLIVYYFRFWKK
jgi:surfeit locus 1 family protein